MAATLNSRHIESIFAYAEPWATRRCAAGAPMAILEAAMTELPLVLMTCRLAQTGYGQVRPGQVCIPQERALQRSYSASILNLMIFDTHLAQLAAHGRLETGACSRSGRDQPLAAKERSRSSEASARLSQGGGPRLISRHSGLNRFGRPRTPCRLPAPWDRGVATRMGPPWVMSDHGGLLSRRQRTRCLGG